MIVISEKTWKLFVPILIVIIMMFLSFYSRDLLKYGNRDLYPIAAIVSTMLIIIIGLGVIVILFMIEIYLSNYLQEMRIIDLEKDLEKYKE